ncbi:MAG: hypothetical protein M1821_001701 [Bathelium mastoideum]|nr:MAG: hypothetical protein M1821_001701 [Bathelium mastoideum]KAI9691593.1 MAG: hypothetical protein M1822_007664 [Bathelium mastoideum]
MSYYDNSSSWSAPGRQPSWEQQAPPSRSGASSAIQRDDNTAFGSQFDEVDRAADNLIKSGKMFGMMSGMPGRRDSMPGMGGARPFPEYDRGGPQRHHSVSDYDGRPGSSHNLQNFYANQRFQPRQSEAEQMMQQKRRMAAQRERELRNYHQEQQYNRSVTSDMSGAKSDRSMSPNTMNEEERRELIARQHRALYGNDSNIYPGGDNTTPRQAPQDARVPTSAGGARGNSPLAFDPFGTQKPSSATAEPSVQMPVRDQQSQKQDPAALAKQTSRRNSNSSPSSSQPTSFGLFDAAQQQSSRTSTSSPGGSPPLQGGPKSAGAAGPAPIGTRPTQQSQSQAGTTGSGPGLNKRSTTPLPSPLSYGLSANEQSNAANERSTSAASNPSGAGVSDKGVGLGGWGSNSGVWGTTGKNLGVQASVWG